MTELDFAKEICEAVMDVWEPTPAKPIILNLPATVEVATPNVYADQIEWMHRNLARRDSVLLSLHPHNDRGTGVAAAELAVMAGADRIEGCLFGNGERTGNVCLVTLGDEPLLAGHRSRARFFRHGRDHPHRRVLHRSAGPSAPSVRGRAGVHRVFRLAPGRDQEGARGAARGRGGRQALWEVPYLPIDPADVGRTYEAVIRVNSQSGKGGIAYLLERDYGLALPRLLQIEFSQVIQQITDATGKELSAAEIHAAFEREYLRAAAPIAYVDHRAQHSAADGAIEHLTARLKIDGVEAVLAGDGNGPVDAFIRALRAATGLDVHVLNYHEHGVGSGEDATAVAYVQLRVGADRTCYGVGLDPNIVTATLRAVISATNRAVERGWASLPQPRQVANA